jgi:hypothetical protein
LACLILELAFEQTDPLKAKQQAALVALLTERTIAQAALKAKKVGFESP